MKPKHELSPSAKAALEGYRRASNVDAVGKARMWRAISHSVEAVPAVDPRPAIGAGKVVAVVVASTLAAAGLVSWLGAASFAPPASNRAPDAASYDRVAEPPANVEPPSRPPEPAAAEVEPEPAVAPPEPPSPPAAAPKKSRSRSRSTRPTTVDAPDPLASEMQLLGDARALLDRGSHSGALARLAEHERRFPSGQLSQERAALRIEALCGSGQRKQGRGEAQRFLDQWPDSHHAQKIRRACDLESR